MDFPKSSRISEGLRPLLGDAVFLTNGETWKRQRRIIDPAFEGGRIRDTYAAMLAAGQDTVTRLDGLARDAKGAAIEIEAEASHGAADVIFRTLFSIPITHHVAAQVFDQFRAYQRTQPILNIAAFVPLPKWMPRFHRRETLAAAKRIRGLIRELTDARATEIAAGQAPDDLATKIMTTPDPETGQCFSTSEMADQVAIFFLAGHETSASALGWALYLMGLDPDAQARARAEAVEFAKDPSFSNLSKLRFTRDCFREALRLYPPVPMMVREATKAEHFRDRDLAAGAQVVISPWHIQRHEHHWDNPDAFDPDRFQTPAGKEGARCAYLPFSAGPRVCTGAGFAMVEGPLFLALILARFAITPDAARVPEPVAHLTVRAKDGIWLQLTPLD